MEVHDLAGDFLDVGDAEEADGHLGDGIVAAHDGVSADQDVARAVGAFAVVDGNDVGGSAGLDGAAPGAANDHDALVGDCVRGAASLEVGPERSQNNGEADEQERQAEERKDAEGLGKGIGGLGDVTGGLVGAVDPEKSEAGEGNAEERGGKRGDGSAAGVGEAGPVETFTGVAARTVRVVGRR